MNKKKQFKRPTNKKNYHKPRVFKKHFNNFGDTIDTGKATLQHKNRKGIIRKSHDKINRLLKSLKITQISLKKSNLKAYYRKLIKNDLYHLQDKLYLRTSSGHDFTFSIEDHLKGKYFLYYTNKPDALKLFGCLDFDNIDSLIRSSSLLSDIHDVIAFLNLYFPGSYYDYGSSGKSLNYYLLIDISYLSELYYYNEQIDTNLRFPRFVNKILSNISYLLRFVFNTPTDYCKYNLKFDAIKGTMSDYETTTYQNTKYYKRIISSGTFAKLPRPTTPQQYHQYYHSPSVDIRSLINLSYYLFHSSLLSFSEELYTLSDYSKSYYKAVKAAQFLQNILLPTRQQDYSKAHPFFLHSAQKKMCGFKPETPSLNKLPIYKSSISMNTGFPVVKEKQGKKRENQRKYQMEIDSLKEEPDAFIRLKEYCFYLFVEYYYTKNRLPTFQEYLKSFGEEIDTDLETDERVRKARYIYDWMKDDWFKEEKVRKSHYVVGDYLSDIKKLISQEQIKTIKNKYYQWKITYEDIDVAIGYFFINLMTKKEMKQWCNKELTVPQNNMVDWFRTLKETGQIKRSCNYSKAKALREIVLHIGWLECVDESYCNSDKKHRSRRYVFTEIFPKYKQFEKYIGKKVIDYWKQFRQEQLKQREEKQWKKKIG